MPLDGGVKLFRVMLELQDSMNQTVDPNWRHNFWPWHRAVWTECAELMELCHWKWWKGEPNDLEKNLASARGEAIDILHFVMSGMLQSPKSDPKSAERVAELFDKYWWTMIPRGRRMKPAELPEMHLHQVTMTTEALASNVLLYSSSGQLTSNAAISYMGLLMHQLGMTLDDVFKTYVGKNTLNTFRQMNGYKEGSYDRTWRGIDDNDWLVHLQDGMMDIDPEEYMDVLRRKLEEEYLHRHTPR